MAFSCSQKGFVSNRAEATQGARELLEGRGFDGQFEFESGDGAFVSGGFGRDLEVNDRVASGLLAGRPPDD